MNLGTLCLVCTLRSTVAADRRRAQENFLENCQPQITSSAPVMQIGQAGNNSDKNNQPTLSHESSGGKLEKQHAPLAAAPIPPMHLCPQTVAMRRLAADLSTTIPCILALALTILVELAILVNRRFMNMTWALQEFVSDLSAYFLYTCLRPNFFSLDHGQFLLCLLLLQYLGFKLLDIQPSACVESTTGNRPVIDGCEEWRIQSKTRPLARNKPRSHCFTCSTSKIEQL